MSAPAAPTAVTREVAVFMDNANDGEFEPLKEIYEEYSDKKSLLTYSNKRATATALHLAANNGHSEIVIFLVDCISKDFPDLKSQLINKKNKYGFTPLMSACFRGYMTKGKAKDADQDRIEIVKHLLANGAKADYVTEDTKMTATHWAAYNKDCGVVKELLKNGAPPFAFSHMGRLPIDVGGSSRAYEVVDACLDSYYESIVEGKSGGTSDRDYATADKVGGDQNFESRSARQMMPLQTAPEISQESEADKPPDKIETQHKKTSSLVPQNLVGNLLGVNKQQIQVAQQVKFENTEERSNSGQMLAQLIAKKFIDKVLAKEIIAIKRMTTLKWVDPEVIFTSNEIYAKALYLYWACFRGHIPLIKHILDQDQISPFVRVYEGRSPLMASLIGKHLPAKPDNGMTQQQKQFSASITNRAQVELCSREYQYLPDQTMLENQMIEQDSFGNNALHFAFRTKKPATVDLIIRAGYGDIDHRNQQGQTPKEAAHNAVMVQETKALLAQFDPTSQRPRDADYLFVASARRYDVLIDQLVCLGLEYKVYKSAIDPENKVIVLVFFDDQSLNKEAEEQGLKIQLQDKYQTLAFKDAGRTQYQRFKSSERYQLMISIFKKEFNVKTLIDGGVVYEHFMPHTAKKYEIIESLEKHSLRLIWNMLSMTESFMKHFEPINLIADYYGEKYALYLAFFFHHVGWFLVPAVFGTCLFIYHLVIGADKVSSDEGFFISYLKNVDTPVNYFYIMFIALWSTFYVESWKRKQATIKYIWGLTEKEDQITQSSQRAQDFTEFVYDEWQGKMTKVVMAENECRIKCTNFVVLILFMSVAVLASIGTIELQDAISFDEEKEVSEKNWWLIFTVFLNSVVVAILTKFFSSIVEYIVTNENHGEDQDYENSMITKSFLVSFVVCMTGLLLYAFDSRSFFLLNLLMIFLIVFKQILLNTIEACQPNRTYPKKFEGLRRKFKPHCRKYPNDYEEFSMRSQHFEAEQQTLMGEMSSTRTEGFNELIIEYGWIVMFPPAFPAAALIALVSNAIQYKTEKDAIKKFNKRCEPMSALDIGKWLDYFEMISTIGIINGACLIIFTSEKLTVFSKDGDTEWADLVVTVFVLENVLIMFRMLLAAIIPDNPAWIEHEMFANENRVKQVQSEIQDKTIMQINSDPQNQGVESIDFVENCLNQLHHDRDLAALLVGKLLNGCNKFINLYQDIQLDQTQSSVPYVDPKKAVKLQERQPFQPIELKKKLKKIQTIVEEEYAAALDQSQITPDQSLINNEKSELDAPRLL